MTMNVVCYAYSVTAEQIWKPELKIFPRIFPRSLSSKDKETKRPQISCSSNQWSTVLKNTALNFVLFHT